MKICKRCGEEKEFHEFHKKTSNKDGYQSYCKSCNSIGAREWQAANPEKFEESWRKQYGNPRRKATKYGITVEELSSLFEKANGLCSICGRPPHKYLVVDHCHTLGVVRGILCEKCNQALGLMRDDIQSLRRAIDYLEDFAERNKPS